MPAAPAPPTSARIPAHSRCPPSHSAHTQRTTPALQSANIPSTQPFHFSPHPSAHARFPPTPDAADGALGAGQAAAADEARRLAELKSARVAELAGKGDAALAAGDPVR